MCLCLCVYMCGVGCWVCACTYVCMCVCVWSGQLGVCAHVSVCAEEAELMGEVGGH